VKTIFRGVPSIPEKDGERIYRIELTYRKIGKGKVLSFLDYYAFRWDSDRWFVQHIDTKKECWNNYLSTLQPKKNETPEELGQDYPINIYTGRNEKYSWCARGYMGDGYWYDEFPPM